MTSDYRECPCCREPTKPSYLQPGLTRERANEVRQEYTFGWWLWDTGKL